MAAVTPTIRESASASFVRVCPKTPVYSSGAFGFDFFCAPVFDVELCHAVVAVVGPFGGA
jgi:hypothetical protein